MMILDIDFFKKINDTFGHRTGDMVLIEFGQILTSVIRNSDYCARFGGEEFVILLPNTALENSLVVAEKIRKKVEQSAFPTAGRVTCSIGVGQKADDEEKEAFFERVDAYLYEAKRGGRNRTVSATEAATPASQRQ